MKKTTIFLIFICQFILTSCGGDSNEDSLAMKEIIRGGLADPNSAQFKGVLKTERGDAACIFWNAKNRLGGYGEWQAAWFSHVGSSWVLEEIDGKKELCSADFFADMDAVRAYCQEITDPQLKKRCQESDYNISQTPLIIK